MPKNASAQRMTIAHIYPTHPLSTQPDLLFMEKSFPCKKILGLIVCLIKPDSQSMAGQVITKVQSLCGLTTAIFSTKNSSIVCFPG